MAKNIADEVKDTAVAGARAAKGLAGQIIDKELEVIERLAAVLDDRETEVRLKFENLSINGDTAIAVTFLKKKS